MAYLMAPLAPKVAKSAQFVAVRLSQLDPELYTHCLLLPSISLEQYKYLASSDVPTVGYVVHAAKTAQVVDEVLM